MLVVVMLPVSDCMPCPPFTQVYCGNYEYDASERDLERLFDRYGRVERVEFKSGATSWGRRGVRASALLPPTAD